MNSRQVAFNVLEEVDKGAYFNLALNANIGKLEEQVERRFAGALCFTVLENRGRIDYVISIFTDGKSIKRAVKNVLRIGVCQLMYFESVPVSAAVNESVKLVSYAGKRQLAGFVNAVLRKVSENLGCFEYPSEEQEPIKFLSVMYSYPEWLAKKYVDEYGFEFAQDMLSYSAEPGLTCVRPNSLKIKKEEFESKMRFEYDFGRFSQRAYYIRNITAVAELSMFKSGKMCVQGESSMLVVAAADIKKGDKVLDICAAPGGKSALAWEYEPGELVSCDLHPHRVELMKKEFERLGVDAQAICSDALVLNEDWIERFDRVIVDAPCSALGLLYRKPDIKYKKQPEDMQTLPQIQSKILEIASKYVKKGGKLIYSTCTINRKENDEVVKKFTDETFVPMDLKQFLPDILAPRCTGSIQLYPHLDGIDGFFIAGFEKKL